MTPKEFRAELVKIMPGYSWTVHKSSTTDYMEATGTRSSGFNRLSTLLVIRTERINGVAWYEAKSSGFGLHRPWLGNNSGSTLARALRGLQRHYEEQAATYAGHARALQSARVAAPPVAERFDPIAAEAAQNVLVYEIVSHWKALPDEKRELVAAEINGYERRTQGPVWTLTVGATDIEPEQPS